MTYGLACSHRGSPQVFFEHAFKAFLRGDLQQSQDEAHRECQRLLGRSPEWEWKFRTLEAESLLWRGMYADVLSLLNSEPTLPNNKDSQIKILAIQGVAHAGLHQFAEAERTLERAMQLCRVSPQVSCGDVIRARGVLAVQHGQIDAARHFFEQSLEFARAHNDQFLEETALLNLGLTSLGEGHFDEAIDWTNAAYKASTALGAEGEAQAALGNLGWAYYNLGDFEKSLALSLEAEKRAGQGGNAIDELYWITNAGYVYKSLLLPPTSLFESSPPPPQNSRQGRPSRRASRGPFGCVFGAGGLLKRASMSFIPSPPPGPTTTGLDELPPSWL